MTVSQKSLHVLDMGTEERGIGCFPPNHRFGGSVFHVRPFPRPEERPAPARPVGRTCGSRVGALPGHPADILHACCVLHPGSFSPRHRVPLQPESAFARQQPPGGSRGNGPGAWESSRGGLQLLLLLIQNRVPWKVRGPGGEASCPVSRRARCHVSTSSSSRSLTRPGSVLSNSVPRPARGKPGTERLVGLRLPTLLGTESGFGL